MSSHSVLDVHLVWQSSYFLDNGELKPTISLYYITVCGLNSEFRFGILEYIRITDILCQTEIYCNTIHAYIAFKYYANCIFIITIEKALTLCFFILDFILYSVLSIYHNKIFHHMYVFHCFHYILSTMFLNSKFSL